MWNNQHPLEQHLVLALERHKALLEDAQRRRWGKGKARGLGWRGMVGDLLINLGQRLKAGMAEHTPVEVAERTSNTVWG